MRGSVRNEDCRLTQWATVWESGMTQADLSWFPSVKWWRKLSPERFAQRLHFIFILRPRTCDLIWFRKSDWKSHLSLAINAYPNHLRTFTSMTAWWEQAIVCVCLQYMFVRGIWALNTRTNVVWLLNTGWEEETTNFKSPFSLGAHWVTLAFNTFKHNSIHSSTIPTTHPK